MSNRKQGMVRNKKLNVDFIISGDDLKNGKPFTEPGIKVLEKFNINVENMLYVGNTIFDLQFAQNLGHTLFTLVMKEKIFFQKHWSII